jgi:hypothetical protein
MKELGETVVELAKAPMNFDPSDRMHSSMLGSPEKSDVSNTTSPNTSLPTATDVSGEIP